MSNNHNNRDYNAIYPHHQYRSHHSQQLPVSTEKKAVTSIYQNNMTSVESPRHNKRRSNFDYYRKYKKQQHQQQRNNRHYHGPATPIISAQSHQSHIGSVEQQKRATIANHNDHNQPHQYLMCEQQAPSNNHHNDKQLKRPEAINVIFEDFLSEINTSPSSSQFAEENEFGDLNYNELRKRRGSNRNYDFNYNAMTERGGSKNKISQRNNVDDDIDYDERKEEMMYIFIKSDLKTMALKVCWNDTIKNIKSNIEETEGIASKQQILVYAGKQLDGDIFLTLSDYGILKESTILLFVKREFNRMSIYNFYIESVSKKAETLQELFEFDIVSINKLLIESQNQIRTVPSLLALYYMKLKISPKIEFEGHKHLNMFKSETNKIKQDLINLYDDEMDEKIYEMDRIYHKYLEQAIHSKEMFEEAINEKIKDFENNFILWDNDNFIKWILLIENGYFDEKKYDTFIAKIKDIEIDGKHLKEMKNKFLLNAMKLKNKDDQHIIHQHINRIIEHENESNDQRMCGLCIDNSINTVIIPCGHQYLCSQCAQKYQNDKCPICRVRINKIIKVYMSGFSK